MRPATTVITAWETHSPLGCGAEEHTRSARAGVTGHDAGPRVVPGFDVRQVLGAKGTRSMRRATGLAVATTGRLLSRVGLDPDRRTAYTDEEIGLVLATSDNVQAVVDFNRDSWTRARPYDVDPAQAPNLLMNVHAGQCAIRHRLRGPNSTVCGSHLGSLLALNYARRLQQGGHAPAVLCGAVEECSESRSAWAAARTAGSPAPLGEGCVVFLLERSDRVADSRQPLAGVLALEFGFAPHDGAVTTVLADCLRRALDRADVSPGRVGWVAPSAAVDGRGEDERLAVKEVFGQVPLVSGAHDALGDTESVSAAFRIVDLLTDPDVVDGVAAVTATDAEGRVGCALLRIR
jgi:3-oxoacyl-[acyl-carrier-protein] synthase II